ncbi:MAG: DUF2497 domain-containing protein [Hyphomicrobiaceae bacterium]
MAEAQNDSGQSMDDILASIRRIISDEPVQTPSDGDVSADAGNGLEGRDSSGAGTVPSNGQRSDDLSDILEPSAERAAANDSSGLPSPDPKVTPDGAGAKLERTPWPFDSEDTYRGSGGSLKNKLASLDGGGQGAMALNPEPTLRMEVAEQIDALKAEAGQGATAKKPAQDSEPSGAALGQGASGNQSKGSEKALLDISIGTAAATPEPQEANRSTEKVEAVSTPATDVNPQRDAKSTDAPTETGAPIAKVNPAGGPSEQEIPLEPRPLHEQSSDGVSQRGLEVVVPAQGGAAKPPSAPELAVNQTGAERPAATVLAAAEMKETIGTSVESAASAAILSAKAPASASGENKTLEALVTDALKPMLREWLDANLPALIEKRLDAEMLRLAQERKAQEN